VTHPYKVGDPNDSTGTGAVYETITEIIDGSTIRCSTATFVTSQVEAGDIVVISNSSYSTPINHDGEYIVDVVVSETEIVVRPIDEDNLHLLNDAAGGNLVIRPNGLFENNLYLGFEPRLPRMPAGGIKIVLGMKNEFGEVPRDFLLVPAVNSAEEVDAWVLKNLHQKLNFDGVYQGQGNDKGGGFHATIDGRPITLHMDKSTNSRTIVRSGTTSADEILAGNLLQVNSGDEFTLEDVGRSIDLTIGTDEYVDWRILRLLDGRTVELVPPPHQIGDSLPTGSANVTAWTLYDNFLPDFQAAISSVTESALAGGFHHTKVNDGTSSSDLSFAHFEHVTDTVTVNTGSAVTGIGTFTATFSGAELSGMSNNPDNLAPIFPVTHGSTSLRTANSHGAKTYVRILTTEHAGLYELYSLRPDICVLRNLDGTSPAVSSTSVEASFLNLRMGVGVPVFGATSSGRAGLSVHQDGGTSSAVGIRAGWTGTGSGILVTANESNFTGQLGGHTSTGPAIEVTSFAPAYGARIEVTGKASASTAAYRGQSGVHVIAETFAHDLNVGGPTAYRTLGGEWKAAGVLSYQTGKDPAGVFMRDQTTGSGPSNLTDTFPASLVVEDWGTEHVGAAAGQTLYGSLYSPGHEISGIYTGGSGTFNELRPGYTDLSNPPPVFWGDGAAWLGSPYLVAEVTSATASANADFAEFNFAHDYIVTIAQADIPTGISNRSLSELVHLGIGLDGGTYGGTVLAAKENSSGDILLALKKQAGTSSPAAGAYSFKCYGRRWFYSYIDIADYSEIGTGLIASDAGYGSSVDGRLGLFSGNLSAGTGYIPGPDESLSGSGSLRPLITAGLGSSYVVKVPESTSMGDLLSLFSYGQRSGENIADYDVLASNFDVRDEAVWKRLSSAITSSVDGHVSRAGTGALSMVPGQLPGSLGLPDFGKYEMWWAMDTSLSGFGHAQVVRNSGTDSFPGFSTAYTNFAGGGTKIVISRSRSAAPPSGYVYLYLKLSRSILASRSSFRVLVDAMQFTGLASNRNMTVALVRGTALPSVLQETTISVAETTEYKRYVVDFFDWQPEEDLSEDEEVSIRFSFHLIGPDVLPPSGPYFTGEGAWEGEPPVWYVRGFNVHSLERAFMKGNLELQGVLRAAGVRAQTSIWGYQVVGPSGTNLLQEPGLLNDYAPAGEVSTTGNFDSRWPEFSGAERKISPWAPILGAQEGNSVGILPLFQMSDITKSTGDVSAPGSKTEMVEIPGGTTSFANDNGRLIPTNHVRVLSSGGFISILGGKWDFSHSGDDEASYASGSYAYTLYAGSDIYYSNAHPGTRAPTVFERWAFIEYSIPYLFFTNSAGPYVIDATGDDVTDPSDCTFSPNGVGGSTETTVAGVTNAVTSTVHYYAPQFSQARFFQVGRNACAIDAYHPYYDPFFYWWFCYSSPLARILPRDQDSFAQNLAEKTWAVLTGGSLFDPEEFATYRTSNADDSRVNSDFWEMPGRTGFIREFDPPHGSLLSKVEVNLSFIPGDGRAISGGGYTSYYHLGVWHSAPDKEANRSVWTDPSFWDANSGVVVRMWRHDLFGDFGAQEDNTNNIRHTSSAPHGFAELIAETTLDMSDVAQPPSRSEIYRTVELPVTKARAVDRRRYSYFMTVEFFVGCRRKIGSSLAIPGMHEDEANEAKRTAPYTWTTGFPDLWPTAPGMFGTWDVDERDGDSAQNIKYSAAVSWEGHIVRRYAGDYDSVILSGTAFANYNRDFQWDPANNVTSMSPYASDGYSLRRSIYSAQDALRQISFGEVKAYPVVLPGDFVGSEFDTSGVANGVTYATTKQEALMLAAFDETGRPDSDPGTPVVKFRGARLSWITDRLSDGGW
jgi:hypothetical protein